MPPIYDLCGCQFEYFQGDDGSAFIDRCAFYVLNGTRKGVCLQDDGKVNPSVIRLNKIMLNHTGGDWKSFELVIDENGKAKTKFDY